MKPLISDDERIQTVRNFLIARKNGQVKISSYQSITPFVSTPIIKILCDLKKSGRQPIYMARTVNNEYSEPRITGYSEFFTESDAKQYFEWLVAVVSGAEQENVSEDIIKQANNQLYRLIDAFGDDLARDKNVQLIAPYDWQELFTSFDKDLANIKDTVDRHDKDIVEVLKVLVEMTKKNTALLKVMYDADIKLFGENKPK